MIYYEHQGDMMMSKAITKNIDRILAKVRQLRRELIRKREKPIKLPSDAIVVDFPPAEEVHKRLHEVARRIAEQILNEENPYFEIPRRSSDNVIYDPEVDMILMRKSYARRELLNLKSVRKATITMRVLEIIHELLEQNIHATKREVFYCDVALFKKQRESDEALEDIAAMLHCHRTALHVVAAAKGAVIGRLRFREGGDLIDCTKMGTGGKAITPFLDTIRDIDSDAEFILLVEKDAAFLRLAEDKFWEKYPCIIITGKGFADIATREFLKLLVRELKLPVFGLVDADPYGMSILLVYAVGAKRTSYETPFLAVRDIKWLGLRPTDFEKYDLPKWARLRMTDKDVKRGVELMKEPFLKERPKWMEELKIMLQTKEKAEIQALASRGLRFLTQVYLPTKLETGDWI